LPSVKPVGRSLVAFEPSSQTPLLPRATEANAQPDHMVLTDHSCLPA
ncbi:unnamed protein product, partial [Laminaria digitata]